MSSPRSQNSTAISRGDYTALLMACDDIPRGLRDRTLIALGVWAGLRRADLVHPLTAVRGDNIVVASPTHGTATIPIYDAEAREIVATWQAWRRQNHLPMTPLFPSIRDTATTIPWSIKGPLKPDSVRKLLLRRGAQAGVENVRTNRFRPTLISFAREAGWSDYQIRRVLHRKEPL